MKELKHNFHELHVLHGDIALFVVSVRTSPLYETFIITTIFSWTEKLARRPFKRVSSHVHGGPEGVKFCLVPGVKNRRLFEDRLDRSSCGLTRHKAKFPRRSGYRGGNPLEGPGA